jgi:two-component system, cell cycle sensor histidine kinase and response regulator CckA
MAVAPRTILIVEDNAELRSLVTMALRKHGFNVLEADNPFQAVEMVGSGLFDVDLLVADVEMPNMTGDEFAREMRSMRPSLKIVFATGLSPEKGRGFAAVPHDAFLPKPYTVTDVVATVCSTLELAS